MKKQIFIIAFLFSTLASSAQMRKTGCPYQNRLRFGLSGKQTVDRKTWIMTSVIFIAGAFLLAKNPQHH
jgi:hypothetical protein